MSQYYLDASALVKRYVDEAGSAWLRAVLIGTPHPLLFVSRIAIVEVISAFARRLRGDLLTLDEFTTVREAFRSDCLVEYQIMPPTMEVVDLACTLLERHPLRAYDAIHLATAINAQQFLAAQEYPPLIFLAADDRLNQSAAIEGLVIDNPNAHA